MLEKIHVLICYIGACSAVHEDGILQGCVCKGFEISLIRSTLPALEPLLYVVKRKPVVVNDETSAVGKSCDAETFSSPCRNAVPVTGDNIDKCLAYSTVACHEKVDVLYGCLLEKLIVDIPYCPVHILGMDNHGNVAL